MLDQTLITTTVNLLKQVDQTNIVLIADVAKEMGVKKTQLMQHINENPNLFSIGDVVINKKLKGLGIKFSYNSLEENPKTDEWLRNQQKTNAKTLWVTYWDNYGRKEGMYVNGDDANDMFRKGLWRNSSEKINSLMERGILFTTQFYVGGWCDCTTHNITTAINNEGIQTLKKEGWTIIFTN